MGYAWILLFHVSFLPPVAELPMADRRDALAYGRAASGKIERLGFFHPGVSCKPEAADECANRRRTTASDSAARRAFRDHVRCGLADRSCPFADPTVVLPGGDRERR